MTEVTEPHPKKMIVLNFGGKRLNTHQTERQQGLPTHLLLTRENNK